MNEEIKEIIDYLIDEECTRRIKCITIEESKQLLDYITNLQQEINFLKLNNPEMNIEHFRIVKENKRKIDNLRKENKELNRMCELYSKSLYNAELTDYRSRCKKALEKLYCYGEVLNSDFQQEMIKILEGDDNE